MSALHNSEVFGNSYYETLPLHPTPRNAGWTPTVVNTSAAPAAEVSRKHSFRNVALFIAAPFVGLLYALAMPLVGFGALMWFAAKALASRFPLLKTVALTVAAPFIGLAFVLTMPIVGTSTLVWVGLKGLTSR